MMENNNMNQRHGETCNCMGCHWNDMKSHHLGYRIFRKLFVLLLICVAFWFGTRYGEMKTLEYQIRGQERMMMSMDQGSVGVAPVTGAAQ